MNSPFQKRFMSKSPLRSHGRRLKKLDKKIAKADTYDKGGDKDYDYLADLQRQRKDLVASHTDTSTKRTEEEDVQVREDEDAAQGSAVEMQSPLHGYVDASDMVDPNPPTAHMWNSVWDAAANAYGMVTAAKQKKADEDKVEAEKTEESDKLKARQTEFAKRTRPAGTDTDSGEDYEQGDLFGLGPGDKVYDQAYYVAFPEALTKRMSS